MIIDYAVKIPTIYTNSFSVITNMI